MIRNKPILFISDILDPAIQPSALHYQSFESICDNSSLSGFDRQHIDRIGKQLTEAENRLYIEYPGIELTCVHTQKGAYWLSGESLKTALQNLSHQMERTKNEGTMPIWKLTVEELLFNHLDNLKHLVQIYAHDSIHFDYLKISMNGQQDAFMRLFDDCWNKVRRLVERVERWSLNRDDFIHPYFILLDRCRITKTMLDRREIDESILGYSFQDLVNAEKNLEERCLKVDPHFYSNQQARYRDLMMDLLEGERLQKLRAQLWMDLFNSIDETPPGFQGMAQIMERERVGLDSFVSSRMDELQADRACHEIYDSLRENIRHVLDSQEERTGDGLPLTDEEIQLLIAPVLTSLSENESSGDTHSAVSNGKKRSRAGGMAFLNRRR